MPAPARTRAMATAKGTLFRTTGRLLKSIMNGLIYPYLGGAARDSSGQLPPWLRSLVVSGDLSRRSRPIQEPHQAATDDLLGLGHDAVDEFLAGGNVVDEAGDHAAAPGAGIHLALQHDPGIDARDLVVDVVDLEPVALLALDLDEAIDIGVPQHALGVAQAPHDQTGVELGRGDQRVLHVLM